MGLDSSIYATKTVIEKDVDFETDSLVCDEIAYWRNCFGVHNFFKRIYLERGGTDLDFNCCPVKIVDADIDAFSLMVEQDIANFMALNLTTERDLPRALATSREAVTAMKYALKKGLSIYFCSLF